MTTSAEVKEHDESGELTDDKLIWLRMWSKGSPYVNWSDTIAFGRAVIAADRAQRIESTRNAVIEECARHIEDRNEAFGNTFADEIRELLTKDKP